MKLTHRDHSQIAMHEHEEEVNAKRVYVVNSELLPNHYSNISNGAQLQIERIEVPQIVIQKEVQIVEVEKIIKEIQIERIEIPVIIKEIQIEKMEVPVYIKTVEVEIVEKPIIIKEIEYKDLPKWMKVCLAAQIFISIISLLKFLK